MKIGLTFNVRSGSASGDGAVNPHWPDDAEEEFDSPETIEALAAAIRDLGHEVELLGDGEPMLRRLLRRASGEGGRRTDLVFNFAEGTGTSRSRESRVPAALEMLGIPYTGSDPLTLAVTLDKQCAKRLVRSAGVATPDWLVVDGDVERFQSRLEALPLPVIVKPAFEGSSKGIHSTNLVEEPGRLVETVAELVAAYRQPVLVEEFIDGDELTVGIVGNPGTVPFFVESAEQKRGLSPSVGATNFLGIMRIVPLDRSGPFVYSLEVKRDWERLVRYECPAKLAAADTRAVADAALAVWNALGCRDLARIDFRLRNHVPYFLEVNPLPGLNPKSSDLVLMARGLGLSYSDLISRILKAAIERLNDQPLAAAGV